MTDKTIESLEQQLKAKDREIEELKGYQKLANAGLGEVYDENQQLKATIRDYEQALETISGYERAGVGFNGGASPILTEEAEIARQALDKHKEK